MHRHDYWSYGARVLMWSSASSGRRTSIDLSLVHIAAATRANQAVKPAYVCPTICVCISPSCMPLFSSSLVTFALVRRSEFPDLAWRLQIHTRHHSTCPVYPFCLLDVSHRTVQLPCPELIIPVHRRHRICHQPLCRLQRSRYPPLRIACTYAQPIVQVPCQLAGRRPPTDSQMPARGWSSVSVCRRTRTLPSMSRGCSPPVYIRGGPPLPPPIPRSPPLPPRLSLSPRRCPNNCLFRPHTLEATSPAPRRRRCHAGGDTDSPAAGVARLKASPAAPLSSQLPKLGGSGAWWPIDVGTGGLYSLANLSVLKRRDSAHVSRPVPQGGRQDAAISAAPPPFFDFARAARLCVVAVVCVHYERPVSAVRSSRVVETPEARRCYCWRRGQGCLRRRRSFSSSTSCFDLSRPLHVYCDRGGRSRTACV